MPSLTSVTIEECLDDHHYQQVAKLFARSASETYISHSELKYGLATEEGKWVTDMADAMLRRLYGLLGSNGNDAASEYLLAVARRGDEIVAAMLLEFEVASDFPPAVTLHDIIVDKDERGGGVGRKLMEWTEERAKARGAIRIFLESGISNPTAHAFFESLNYRKTAIMMMKHVH